MDKDKMTYQHFKIIETETKSESVRQNLRQKENSDKVTYTGDTVETKSDRDIQ